MRRRGSWTADSKREMSRLMIAIFLALLVATAVAQVSTMRTGSVELLKLVTSVEAVEFARAFRPKLALRRRDV